MQNEPDKPAAASGEGSADVAQISDAVRNAILTLLVKTMVYHPQAKFLILTPSIMQNADGNPVGVPAEGSLAGSVTPASDAVSSGSPSFLYSSDVVSHLPLA